MVYDRGVHNPSFLIIITSMKNPFRFVAWKRTLIIAGCWSAIALVGAQKNLDDSAESVGYFLGYGAAATAMLSTATAVCSRREPVEIEST